MIRSSIVLSSAFCLLAACEPVVVQEQTPEPRVQLNEAEAAAVGNLARQIADGLNTNPRIRANSSLQYFGSTVDGTTIITEYLLPFSRTQVSASGRVQVQNYLRTNFAGDVCGANPDWAVFFGLGGQLNARFLNPSRTLFDQVTINACP